MSQVPLTDWGYGHYGYDKVLPSLSFHSKYGAFYQTMSEIFYDTTLERYNRYPTGTGEVQSLLTEMMKLASSNYDYNHKSNLFSQVAGTSTYRTPTMYFSTLAQLLSCNGIWDTPDQLDILKSLTGDYSSVSTFFGMQEGVQGTTRGSFLFCPAILMWECGTINVFMPLQLQDRVSWPDF